MLNFCPQENRFSLNSIQSSWNENCQIIHCARKKKVKKKLCLAWTIVTFGLLTWLFIGGCPWLGGGMPCPPGPMFACIGSNCCCCCTYEGKYKRIITFFYPHDKIGSTDYQTTTTYSVLSVLSVVWLLLLLQVRTNYNTNMIRRTNYYWEHSMNHE